jgi:hypothetical protein
MRWELPPDTREGQMLVSCLPRFVDARSVSPRKIMIRAGMAALGEGYVRESGEGFAPAGNRGNLQLRMKRFPVRLVKETGEKSFLLDEELTVPESVSPPEKIIYAALDTKISDSRVLSDKLAFRGMGRLHLVFQGESGQIHTWDFEMPFSQYAELDGIYGNDAQSDIRLEVTSLEPERMEDGRIRLKCGLAAQYRISDMENPEVALDAYDPAAEVDVQWQELAVCSIGEERKETIHGESNIKADANIAVDARFLPDFPTVQRSEGESVLAFPGTFQLLYYAEDGKLRGSSARWEGETQINGQKDVDFVGYPYNPETMAIPGNGDLQMRMEMPVLIQTTEVKRIPMVMQVQMGKEKVLSADRPSLVIARCRGEDMWDLARSHGTTVDAIRLANGLEGDCSPDQLLLIPIP